MVKQGFHAGERAVQRRAGVSDDAARLEGMLCSPHMSSGFRRFLAECEFAVITGTDGAGRLWASPLTGMPGFLGGDESELQVAAVPGEGDPLEGLPAGQSAGVLAIDFLRGRRVRVNGRLTRVSGDGLGIRADQAYGNCPRFIQRRRLERHRHVEAGSASRRALTGADTTAIASADTFFLGTINEERGADCSHRGGPPGLVRVEERSLWWPDYAGNNMFNSLGNLAVDDRAALLFVTFATGATLHLSGTAVTEWGRTGESGDDGHTGRRVRFRPDLIISGPSLPLREKESARYPHNPPLT